METSLVIDSGTFRQLAMIAAMQGLLAGKMAHDWEPNDVAARAVQMADALLEANTIEAKNG